MRSVALVSALLLITAGSAAAQYDNPDPGGGDGGQVDCSSGQGTLVRVLDNGFRFEPPTVTIQAGQTVTWCHDGSLPHNVSADDDSFRCANGCDIFGGNGNPDAGWKFSITFTEAGDVPYRCEVHGAAMTGLVRVQGNGGGDGGGGDDEPGSLRFQTGSYTVGEAEGQVALRIQRTGGDDGSVSVQLATSNGSATAGQDYAARNETVSWASGDDSPKTVNVPILDDSVEEGDEQFTASLSNPTGGATLGSPSTTTVTIVDDDQEQGPGQIEFRSFAFGAAEGGNATIQVVRTGGSAGQVSVDYTTLAGSATPQDDYDPRSGTLSFAGGETSKTITVPLKNDGVAEPLEAFAIALSSPGGGATLGAIRRASILIFDDEEAQQALTAEEVLCDEFRLAAFLERFEVSAPNTSKALGANVSYTRLGDFAGIAYTGNGPGTPEHHLAFSTNPEETTFLRNPERPQLFAISLSRNQTNSDLVPPGAADELRVFLNPTLSDDPAPVQLLTIDDLGDPVTREGGTPAESKPGRGIQDAVRTCHGKLTSRDQHVFRVLTKIARATADGAAVTEIAVFRGQDLDTYRLDVYPVSPAGASLGRLAAELEIDFGPGDRLDGGTLTVLGRCTGAQSDNCTSVDGLTELQLVEPKFSGEFWTDSPFSVSTMGSEGDGQPTSNVDFAALLGDTSWRRP